VRNDRVAAFGQCARFAIGKQETVWVKLLTAALAAE
jgi:hypothetical protein